MNKRELQVYMINYLDEHKDDILEEIVEDQIQDVLARINREFGAHPLYEQIHKAVELFEYSADIEDDFNDALKELDNRR